MATRKARVYKAGMSEELDKKAIGERLELIRLASGYPNKPRGAIKRWAEKFGWSQQEYGNWETGLQRIPPEPASAIMHKTGATLDYIYHGKESTLPRSLSDAIDQVKNLTRKSTVNGDD